MLRDAFAAMTKDEQFLKEAEKIGLEVGLIRGEELNRDIESTLRDKRLMDLYRIDRVGEVIATRDQFPKKSNGGGRALTTDI